jgi:Domain of unknown function (DUF4440)
MQWFHPKGSKGSALVLAVIASSVAAASVRPPPGERTGSAVMAVEQHWLTALHHRDVQTLARILGREFIDSDFQGEAITRAQFLAYFAHSAARPAPAVRQTFRDTMVRFVAGGEVAIVTGVVVTRPAAVPDAATASNPPPAIAHSRFTDVFVWRDARWQAVTGQETHFVPAAH